MAEPSTVKLPELPEPHWARTASFNADQMREYATSAVLEDRRAREGVDSAQWPDVRNRGLLQAAKQAASALRKHAFLPWGQPGYPAPTPGAGLIMEARCHLEPAIEREEAFRAALSSTDGGTDA